MNDPLESQQWSLDVVRIYRGAPRGWATHEFGKSFLVVELGGGFECHIPSPASSLCFGVARLFGRMPALLKAQFWTKGPLQPVRGYAKILEGPAVRIRLQQPVKLEIPWDAKGAEREKMLRSVIAAIRPRVREAFLALGHFFDVYRVTRFEFRPDLTETADGRGPWSWMDPARPETFSEFLYGSYASLRSGDKRLVTRIHEPKEFRIGIPEIFDLRETLRQSIGASLDGVRLTMLDAWTALYEGNTWAAVIFANVALESKIRGMLQRRLQSRQTTSLDDILRVFRFREIFSTLLPLANYRHGISPQTLRELDSLRAARRDVLHLGKRRLDWEKARSYLCSAEQVLKALSEAGQS